MPLGGALAGLAVAPMVVTSGLGGALAAIIGALLLTILLVQPFRGRLDEEREAGQGGWAQALLSPATLLRAVRTLRAHPSLPLLTALGASLSVLQACLTAFTATYLITRHGASLVEAGRIVAVMLVASVVGRVALGWLADRVGRALRHLALQSLVSACAVGLMVAIGGEDAWAIVGCAALVGATAIGWNGVHMAELARVAPLPLVSEVTSAAGFFGFVGSICGPLAFTLIVNGTGSYALAFSLAAAQVAVVGLVSLVILNRQRQQQADARA